jgi:cytoskeletal protein CcmA (bactofilin family)
MAGTKKQTVIEDGTEFDGSISSSCEIVLSGAVKGELLAPSLTVSPSGSMHGCAKVEQLISEGEISGEIDAEKVVLSGKVSDQTVINAETLEVKLSQPEQGIQVTFGNCELRVGDKQTELEVAVPSSGHE